MTYLDKIAATFGALGLAALAVGTSWFSTPPTIDFWWLVPVLLLTLLCGLFRGASTK